MGWGEGNFTQSGDNLEQIKTGSLNSWLTVILMAYMGQILNSPALNRIVSQVKSQALVTAEWIQSWEYSQDPEQRLKEHTIGALSCLCLSESSPMLHCPVIPFKSVQSITITKQRSFHFLWVKDRVGGGSATQAIIDYYFDSARELLGVIFLAWHLRS